LLVLGLNPSRHTIPPRRAVVRGTLPQDTGHRAVEELLLLVIAILSGLKNHLIDGDLELRLGGVNERQRHTHLVHRALNSGQWARSDSHRGAVRDNHRAAGGHRLVVRADDLKSRGDRHRRPHQFDLSARGPHGTDLTGLALATILVGGDVDDDSPPGRFNDGGSTIDRSRDAALALSRGCQLATERSPAVRAHTEGRVEHVVDALVVAVVSVNLEHVAVSNVVPVVAVLRVSRLQRFPFALVLVDNLVNDGSLRLLQLVRALSDVGSIAGSAGRASGGGLSSGRRHTDALGKFLDPLVYGAAPRKCVGRKVTLGYSHEWVSLPRITQPSYHSVFSGINENWPIS